jgi:hypothetical protein
MIFLKINAYEEIMYVNTGVLGDSTYPTIGASLVLTLHFFTSSILYRYSASLICCGSPLFKAVSL